MRRDELFQLAHEFSKITGIYTYDFLFGRISDEKWKRIVDIAQRWVDGDSTLEYIKKTFDTSYFSPALDETIDFSTMTRGERKRKLDLFLEEVRATKAIKRVYLPKYADEQLKILIEFYMKRKGVRLTNGDIMSAALDLMFFNLPEEEKEAL